MSKEVYSLITKTHAKNIWRRYIKAIEEYRLIKDGDRIFVPHWEVGCGPAELLASRLLKMTAEFKMYRIEVVEGEALPGEETGQAVINNCNKLVSPDIFQDIAVNTLWEMLYNAGIGTLLPKEKTEGITLIRPLYLINEKHLEEWYEDYCELEGIQRAETEKPQSDREAERAYIRSILKRLSATNEAVENNVFGSVTNVDADMLLGCRIKGEYHRFPEWYE